MDTMIIKLLLEYGERVSAFHKITEIDKRLDELVDLGFEFDGMNKEYDRLEREAEWLLDEIEALEKHAKKKYGVTFYRTEHGVGIDNF